MIRHQVGQAIDRHDAQSHPGTPQCRLDD